MGRLKEHLRAPAAAPFARAGGGARRGNVDLTRCNRANPCPACGRRKFCRVKRDGSEAWCTSNPDGAAATLHNELGPVYVHALSGQRREAAHAAARLAPTAAGHATTLDADVLHRAHCAVLGRLGLDDADHAALVRRGLTHEDIERNGYRTLPERRRAELARALVDALGEPTALRVPGVWTKEEEGRSWLSLAGAPGLLIPCRDLEGRVVAMKVRRRDPCDGARYLWVASTAAGGPGARQIAHAPLAARAFGGDVLWLTEGELKADVATALGGVPVVGMPGTAATSLGVDAALAWGARRVVVAIDMDWRTNPRVAADRARLVEALFRAGLDVQTEEWPDRWKGLDDWYLMRAMEVHRGG